MTNRNIISKVLSCIFTASLLVTMLGCNNGSATDVSASEDKKDSVAETTDTIKMITWSNDSTVEALNEINDMFYKDTGIKVELVDVPSTDYDEFLRNCIDTGDADIFCYTIDSKAFAQPVVDWAPSDVLAWESIIMDGNALDLSGYDFINNWSTGAKACTYKDGIYGIATGMTIMNGMFYNKKMFDEHGWNEPRTWEEFVKLCDNMVSEGIAPITVGGADTWPVQMITNAIVDSVVEGNSEELIEGLWKGNHTYTDDESLEIYNRELKILSYLEDGAMELAYADGPSHFVEGNAAMLYDGSWSAAEIEAADPNFEYDYFAIPGNTKHNFTGKYDLTFGINAKSDKIEASVKWLEYFSNPDIYTIFIDKNGFVPTMSWISTSNKFLSLIDDRINDADRTYECFNRVPDGVTVGTYDLIHYSIVGGTFETPEDFAQAAQKDWDEAIDKLSN